MPPDAADATTSSTALTVVPTDPPGNPGTMPAPDRRIEDFIMIPISLIDPNPNQPRHEYSPVAISSLAESIRVRGLLQPIVVMPVGGGRWCLLAGERRRRASAELGRPEIPAVEVQAADSDPELLSIVENTHRLDLNIIELASAASRLSRRGLGRDTIAKILGTSPSAISKLDSLRRLPPTIFREYDENVNVSPDMQPPRDMVPIGDVVTPSDIKDLAAMWAAAHKACKKGRSLDPEMAEALYQVWVQVRVGKWKRAEIREMTKRVKDYALNQPSARLELLSGDVKKLSGKLVGRLAALDSFREEMADTSTEYLEDEPLFDSGDCIDLREIRRVYKAILAEKKTPDGLLNEEIDLLQAMLEARGKDLARSNTYELEKLWRTLHDALGEIWKARGREGYHEAIVNLKNSWDVVKSFDVGGHEELIHTYFMKQLHDKCATIEPWKQIDTISDILRTLCNMAVEKGTRDEFFRHALLYQRPEAMTRAVGIGGDCRRAPRGAKASPRMRAPLDVSTSKAIGIIPMHRPVQCTGGTRR